MLQTFGHSSQTSFKLAPADFLVFIGINHINNFEHFGVEILIDQLNTAYQIQSA